MKLYVRTIKNSYGVRAYTVVDINEVLQTSEQGMSFRDLAYEREEKQKAFEKAIEAVENVYADAEVIYEQAVNVVDICQSLMNNNEEEFADFPKRDAFRRWRRS